MELRVAPSTSESSQITSRLTRRVCIPIDVLKARKICAGDPITLTRKVEDALQSLSLGDAEIQPVVIGIAWPWVEAKGLAVQTSAELLQGTGFVSGDSIAIDRIDKTQIHTLKSITLSSQLSNATAKSETLDAMRAYVKELLVDMQFVSTNIQITIPYAGTTATLTIANLVASTTSSQTTLGKVTADTAVVITSGLGKPSKARVIDYTSGYDAVGGLGKQIETIRELVELPLRRPDVFAHFNLTPPRGLLLHGPPGTGKTLLCSAIAKSLALPLFSISGSALGSPYHGETESRLRAIFEEAKEASPSLVLIDEIDGLAPKREEAGEVERRVVATLLTLMDGLDSKPEGGSESPRIIVIAATNRPNSIDPALRRPGRFDLEVEIGVPDLPARLEILQTLLRRTPHSCEPEALQSISDRAHGFVGADLASLVHSACLSAIKRSSSSLLAGMQLLPSDLEAAFATTRPSGMREVYIETPRVSWHDVGGQESVKQRLRECVEWPLQYPDSFKRLGVRPPRGILLYGPPGCSKTLLAKALASQAKVNFLAVKGPELFNKYVGESERAVRELFRKARAAQPSIIFLDEIDVIAGHRGTEEGSGSSDRVLTSLLTEMDGIEELNGVTILAATNRPDVIDAALMRPGRLDRILYVGPPDFEGRLAIFQSRFAKMSVAPDVAPSTLAGPITEGCSGAEVVSICQDAALRALKDDRKAPFVSRAHFEAAAKDIRRRITPDSLRFYERWRDQAGVQSA
ncbi:uncharacterized protein L969DRAFT_95086 [Mixia osmundae IAM 14324]|uniref:AAA+ ATPase domain-containing protein n=1 Tax=Mixia osmundae (strain CBS 9802 / IAM 14324 / JCM 22182 / KY 12970) TaxID=764103 RepID=G7E7F5_MIXOS|nr:uncharacterized protein L969DRAFT_95086 [Mixia osmundae IAM 14324]KEI38925.1 hypothetical protein L969DRAFT_95086 [Mixia osmundae IAM 14324]GAA98765.1 hypothetical protein E5Q_05453 [Mixia osmundae IAM 14324]